jgi:dienelactone hydrolase
MTADSPHLTLIIRCLLSCLIAAMPLTRAASAQEHADLEPVTDLLEQVLALGDLTEAPKQYPADGFPSDGPIKPIFYQGLPWQGKPTRVFAWLGLPEHHDGKLPGIVLVHGGGGTAFKEWVQKWNDHGYAAISIAVEGQTDIRDATTKHWLRHDWPGPARNGIYGDSDQPLTDQRMYHAVADTILAHSLLRSLPEVDPDQVGLMGISWGGVVTSTVIGIDPRFAFAIPTYGCGDMAPADNQWGRALGDNPLYQNVWDPMVRLNKATTPTLWLSWTGDQHFPLDSLRNCYHAQPGPHSVALLPNMRHSHAAGWNPPDSYAFADSIITTGKPWCRQISAQTEDNKTVRVEFTSTKPIDQAVLTSTTDTGFTGNRTWSDTPAKLSQTDAKVTATAPLPPGTTAWFINLRSNNLTASSDFYETALQ